jgi:hypothetical protein
LVVQAIILSVILAEMVQGISAVMEPAGASAVVLADRRRGDLQAQEVAYPLRYIMRAVPEAAVQLSAEASEAQGALSVPAVPVAVAEVAVAVITEVAVADQEQVAILGVTAVAVVLAEDQIGMHQLYLESLATITALQEAQVAAMVLMEK